MYSIHILKKQQRNFVNCEYFICFLGKNRLTVFFMAVLEPYFEMRFIHNLEENLICLLVLRYSSQCGVQLCKIWKSIYVIGKNYHICCHSKSENGKKIGRCIYLLHLNRIKNQQLWTLPFGVQSYVFGYCYLKVLY